MGGAGRYAGYGQENGGIPASARRNVEHGQENGGFSADAGRNVRGMHGECGLRDDFDTSTPLSGLFSYICSMKQISSFIPILFLICSCAARISPGEHLALQEGWMLTSENTGFSCVTKVPSTVAGALYDCGALPPNVLEGDN